MYCLSPTVQYFCALESLSRNYLALHRECSGAVHAWIHFTTRLVLFCTLVKGLKLSLIRVSIQLSVALCKYLLDSWDGLVFSRLWWNWHVQLSEKAIMELLYPIKLASWVFTQDGGTRLNYDRGWKLYVTCPGPCLFYLDFPLLSCLVSCHV